MQYTPSHEVERVIKDVRAKGGAYVSVRLRGTGTSFKREIHDLLSRDWLSKFSPQDVALLAYVDSEKLSIAELNFARSSGIERLPMICASYYVSLFLIAFIAPTIASEYVRRESSSLTQLIVLLVSFPIYTTLVSLVSELYGSRVSRTLAMSGFAAGGVILAVIYVAISAHGIVTFPTYLSHTFRCLASLAAGYLLGEAARFWLFSRRTANTSRLHWSLRFFLASMMAFSISCYTCYQAVVLRIADSGLGIAIMLVQFIAAVPIVALFSVLASYIIRHGAEEPFLV